MDILVVLMMELCWVSLMVLFRELEMALFMNQHWESHLDLPMAKWLALIRASYPDLLIVK